MVFLHSRQKIADEDLLRRDGKQDWVVAQNLIAPRLSRVALPSTLDLKGSTLNTVHADPESRPITAEMSFEESSIPPPPPITTDNKVVRTALVSVTIALLLTIIMLLSVLPSHGDTGIGDGVTSSSTPSVGPQGGDSEQSHSQAPVGEVTQQTQECGEALSRKSEAILNESLAVSDTMAISPRTSSGNAQSADITVQMEKSALSSDPDRKGKLASDDDEGLDSNQERENSRFVIKSPGKTSLFGLSDVGRSFVYLIDCSKSMSGYGALNAAKAELITSISNLKSRHRFQIVFYNHAPMPLSLGGRWGGMFSGSKSDIEFVKNQIHSIPPDGGTNHLYALLRGLAYKPDVVFLLTDATEPGLSRDQLNDVKQSNSSSARIHCIEFGLGPELSSGEESLSQSFMKTLSAETGGRYAYRDVTQLQHSQP